MGSVLTVRQLSEQLRGTVERSFPYVWVQGEVASVSRPPSGHVYFSLKEEECLLNCVWFRGRQKDEAFDPMTGEVWEDGPHPCLARTLEAGQTLICAGRLCLYASRSQYQLTVDLAQAAGKGLWHQQFEALKRRLFDEGLFAQEHKRPIPQNPVRVAVVTAPKGAAIRDFIRISNERGTGAQIRIFPTLVQGDEAPPLIAEALRHAALPSGDGWLPEVIVLIRGGGSVQDLWAFNDERVARAVFDSPVPVLTGIGHEIDLSITDLAADFSAATPSHTAQMLWTERSHLLRRLTAIEDNLLQAMDHALERCSTQAERLVHTLKLLSPSMRLQEKASALDNAVRRMDAVLNASLSLNAQAIERLTLSLAHSSSRPERLAPELNAMTHRLWRAGESLFSEKEKQAERAAAPLASLGRHIGSTQERRAAELAARLLGLDPFEPLKRGYAFVQSKNGAFLRSVLQIHSGNAIDVRMGDGVVHALVESVENKQ